MNSNDNALDLVSEQELTLGPSSHCIQGRLSDESGVGANAASGIETPFVAGNPFSELVWSPRNGLSLRSPIGGVPERKSSGFLRPGPSHMVNMPPSSFIELPAIAPAEKDEPMCKSEFEHDPEYMVEMNTSSHVNITRDGLMGPKSLREKDMVRRGNTIEVIEATESNFPGLQDGRMRNVLPVLDNINTKPVELLPGVLNKVALCDSLDLNGVNEKTRKPSTIKGGFPRVVIDLKKSMDTDALILNPPSLWQGHNQSNANLMEDNELRSVVNIISKSDVGIKKSLQREKEKFALELGEVSKASPIRALASERKGKEKIVSYGEMNERRSGEDSDGYGSAESCNSAKRLGAGKKRVLDFEEQATSGHKRLKLQIQETPAYKSGTSFMTWISMLMKGSSRPDEDRSPLLGDASREDKGKTIVACIRAEDTKCGKTGFKSIFQSLGRSNSNVQDQRFISGHPRKSESFKLAGQKTVSNDSLRQSVLAGDPHPLILKRSVASLPSDCNDTAFPNSEFAVRKCETDSGGDDGFFFSYEEKLTDDYLNKRNRLSQLWLSHFCPKSSGAEFSKGSDILSGFAHSPQNNIKLLGHSSEEPSSSSSKKLHSFSLDGEVACAVKRSQGKRVNPVAHYHRYKITEAIASIFAKRFDGLLDKVTSSATACFFCGITGHDLRYCPQLTEGDVDDLLTNITAFDEAEESHCFCIKCFQLNHWAVSCPNAPSRKSTKSEHDEMCHQRGFGKVTAVKDGCGSSPRCHRPCRTVTGLDVEKINARRAEENDLEAPVTSYPHSPYGRRVMDIPTGIFEAVKILRLSRSDILKCMRASPSIPHLDGCYLRLRRSMLAEGLQGAGHYVACISGLEEEKPAERSKELIPIILGGIRCHVETQCISDQDFLEDELMAWWSATLRGGGKVPSEGELRSKVDERSRLGF